MPPMARAAPGAEILIVIMRRHVIHMRDLDMPRTTPAFFTDSAAPGKYLRADDGAPVMAVIFTELWPNRHSL